MYEKYLLLQRPETNPMGLFSFTFESLGTPEEKKVILALVIWVKGTVDISVLQLLTLLNLIKILQ